MINRLGLLGLLIAFATTILLTGCGGSDGDEGPVTLVGTWDADSATVTSPELPSGTVTVSSSLGMFSGTVVFNADGTFSLDLDLSIINENHSFAGTWSASSAELKITSEGERGEASYTISGRTLVVTYQRDANKIVIEASKR